MYNGCAPIYRPIEQSPTVRHKYHLRVPQKRDSGFDVECLRSLYPGTRLRLAEVHVQEFGSIVSVTTCPIVGCSSQLP